MIQIQTPAESFSPAASVRSGWVDAARGVGILFVVFGHVWRGVEAAGILRNAEAFHLVDSFIYSFHMPLFFVLSGMFFERSVAARLVGTFVADRVVRLLWPLLLWTWIYFAFKALAGSLVNVPVGWTAFPWFPLPPREQFWFLWALFLIQVVLTPLAILGVQADRDDPTLARGRGLWIGVLAATTVVSSWPLGASAPWFVSAFTEAPYFVLGVLIGRFALPTWGRGVGLAALAAFLAGAGAAALVSPGHFGLLACGSVATLGLLAAIRARPWPIRGPLQLLGTASLAIYVAHVIFSASARILLLAIGQDGLALHLAVGCFVGVFGPLLLFFAARRAGIQRLAGF